MNKTKEKKQSSAWYIAATHYLTAGFVIPLIINIILGLIAIPFIGQDNLTVLIPTFVIIDIIGIALGVMYAASYLNKTYILSEKKKVINFALAYFITLRGGLLAYTLIMSLMAGMPVFFAIVQGGGFIIAMVMFYVLSKKYIKHT